MSGASVPLAERLSGGFWSRVPIVLQSEAAECGLACMAMVSGFHGRLTGIAGIRRHVTTSLKGMTLRDMIQIGGSLGLATRAVRLDLDDLGQLRLPCILHWSHNHFVVLTKLQRNSMVIHDPAIGRRVVSTTDFSENFTGVALEAWPTAEFQKADERERIRILDLVRRTCGIGWATLQVLAISCLLELALVAAPIGFQLILDEVVVAADRDLLTVIVLALGLLLVLQVFAEFARSWITMLVGSSLTLQWKVSLFDQLMRLPLSFFEKRHVGDIVSRFSSFDAIQRTLTVDAITALLDGVMAIVLVLMMWLYGGWLLAIALLSAAIYTLIRVLVYLPYRAYSEDAIIHAAQENTHFMESVRGIASLKALNLEARRRGVWVNYLVDRINADLRVEKLRVIFGAASTGLFGIDRLLIIFLGVRLVMANELSVGMFVAFLAYKDQFVTRINRFIDTAVQFMMLSMHGERIADVALAPPEAAAAPAAWPATRSGGHASSLQLTRVRFRYADNERDVLPGVSLNVTAGECIGIAGPSGVGKTTLLKIMAGLIAPTDGKMLVDGVPVTPATMAPYRSQVGCVLQDDQLFAGSIADNIASFDPDADPAWVQLCANMAAIHEEIVAMPMGYETLVGDMGSTLSGGQRQRVVLARALYRRPSILFLDEATSHLDSNTEARINAAVKELPMTRIMIAHRASTLALADRVLRLGAAPGGRTVQASASPAA